MASLTIKSTCPRDCYDSCGIVVEVRDGAVHRVSGDPDHHLARGKLCAKCALAYNGAWLDPAARVTSPLRRTGPRGSGQFEAVSWDTALSEIAARLGAVTAERGPAGVLYSHYTGTLGLLNYLFPSRFFHRLGATEVDPDTVCNKAGEVALLATTGAHADGFDPATIADSRCVLLWGVNPSATAPHVDEHWLGSSGATVIVVDPIAHATARRADLHLQLRPGTDAALAFGLRAVLVDEGLVDDEFVAEHVAGWDELADVEVSWAAEVTGVAESLLRQAARVYAAGPSLLWLGQGLQRQAHGANAMRAAMTLVAATGNVGRPGAGYLYLNGSGRRVRNVGKLLGSHLCAEPVEPIAHADLADALADPSRFGALITYNTNPLASAPNQRRLRQALDREDLFQVSIEVFPTDTADHADYVLPAATFLECDDVVAPYFDRAVLSAQVKAVEPPGEALPNTEIFRRLAAAMGFAEPELFETDAELIHGLLDGTDLDWATLAAAGTVRTSTEPTVQRLGFRTASGRIEVASAAAVAAGMPRTPQPLADPAPPTGWLRVLSPASVWSLNSSYGNDARIQRRLGATTATVNTAVADSFGLASGQRVELVNDTGRLVATLALDDTVPDGVVLVPKGRWPKLSEGGANVNVLYDGAPSDAGRSSAVHSVVAMLRLLDAAVPTPR